MTNSGPDHVPNEDLNADPAKTLMLLQSHALTMSLTKTLTLFLTQALTQYLRKALTLLLTQALKRSLTKADTTPNSGTNTVPK